MTYSKTLTKQANQVPTVAVDFDGTIATKGPSFEQPGKPLAGAKKALDDFKRRGYRIIIHSVRGDKKLIADYLNNYDIPFTYINYNPDQPPNTSGKVFADVYIDDRSATGSPAGKGWKKIRREANRRLEQAWDRIVEQKSKQEKKSHSYHLGSLLKQAAQGDKTPKGRIQSARRDTNTKPTDGQAEVGNYKKGVFRVHGLEIKLENPKGSVRSGVSPDGKAWSNTMSHDYGYFTKTEGKDGDAVDVFIGPNLDSETVFVVNQVKPGTNNFDEHKVMLGFDSEDKAKKGYLSNYQKNWKGLGSITPMTVDQFKEWLDNADTTKPAKQPQIKKAAQGAPGIPNKSNYGDLSKLKAGQVLDYILQKHEAERAGTHHDLRFGDKNKGLYSWAVPRGLPQPGQKHLAPRTQLHSHKYKDFTGRIPKGKYGAGKVSKADKGQVLIDKVSPNAIHFSTAHSRQPERFALVKPTGKAKQSGTQENWLLVNTTPTEKVPVEKIRYTKIPSEEIEPALEKLQKGDSVSSKIDGACFPGYQTVLTEIGWKRIDDIVENRLDLKVASKDSNGDTAWNNITRYYKRSVPDNLVRLRTWRYPRSPIFVTCTPNHEIYTPSGKIRAENLKVGDPVYIRSTTLSEDQQQILWGLLISDGSIYKEYARFSITQTSNGHKDWLDWLKDEVFADISYDMKPHYTTKSKHLQYKFITNAMFRHERNKWYPNDKKEIPEEIVNKINPLGLAMIYLADGSLGKHKRSGRIQHITLHLDDFDYKSVDRVKRMLNRFDIKCKIKKHKETRLRDGGVRFNIIMHRAEATKFLKLIAPYSHKSMDYKFKGSNNCHKCNNCNKYIYKKHYCDSCCLKHLDPDRTPTARQYDEYLESCDGFTMPSSSLSSRFGGWSNLTFKLRNNISFCTDQAKDEDDECKILDLLGQKLPTLDLSTREGWAISHIDMWKIAPYNTGQAGNQKVKFVYDLEVENDHNYVVKGLLVSNSTLIQLSQKGIEQVSYRTDTKTGRPILQTEKVHGETPYSEIPKELVGTILRGEVYGSRERTPEEVERQQEAESESVQNEREAAIPPQELGGILNSSIAKSLQTQKDKGVDLKTMLFDIQQYGKKPIDFNNTPYEKRKELINRIKPYLPNSDTKYRLPQETTDPDEAKRLYRDTFSGKNPLTSEGFVVHPQRGRPMKAKNFEEQDVYLTGTFPGQGKYKGLAGGLTYALEPNGQTVGKIGTGMSDEFRRWAEENKDILPGRVARISSQNQLPSGAYRAPALIALHEDYPSK